MQLVAKGVGVHLSYTPYIRVLRGVSCSPPHNRLLPVPSFSTRDFGLDPSFFCQLF